jgi:hypothetical protein
MESAMIEIWVGVISFVTGFVSFLYGTRICWECCKNNYFTEKPETRKSTLRVHLPVATALYLFGFMLVFGYVFDDFVSKYVYSLTSAILLSHFFVSMAIPTLKRNPSSPAQHKNFEAPTIHIESL